MSPRFLLTHAPLVFVPSLALAGEPSRGTVITIASVGAWIIISSLGIVLRNKRDAGAKPGDATAPADDKNA